MLSTECNTRLVYKKCLQFAFFPYKSIECHVNPPSVLTALILTNFFSLNYGYHNLNIKAIFLSLALVEIYMVRVCAL